MIEVAARDGVALMPNPHQVSLERFAEFTPEQQADMQSAYVTLQASAGRSMGDSRYTLKALGTVDHIPFYNQVGFDRFTQAFTSLRYVAGEDEFGGLRPVHLDDTERTTLPTYFTHVAVGELIVTEWGEQDFRHDLKVHIMGALLTHSTVKAILVESANVADEVETEIQEKIAGSIDAATAQVNKMWMYPVELPEHQFGLLAALNRLDRIALKGAISFSGAERIAGQQADFVRDFVAKDLFVPPNPVR
ncbi:MAG: hypothetical protein QG553_159 [Patescibacteria group bacterium]|nr:hypothetical protein [Patescibacteria group bacterium]